jgi:hypothetical protein
MRQRSAVWIGVLVALGFAMVTGCGGGAAPEGGVKAEGRLLEGGQPAKLANFQDGYVYYEVTFLPTGGGAGLVRSVDENGAFPISGIEAGSYRVGVAKIVDTGAEQPDEWAGKYSADKSSVTVQVEEGKEVTIELNDVVGSGKAK